MAIIKDFFKEKEKRHQDSDVDYREKIRAHKFAVFIRTVIIIAVLVCVIILFNTYGSAKKYTDTEISSQVSYTLVNGATAKSLGDHIFVYSKDGANCMDTSGKAVWNVPFQMQSPIVSICGQTVAIGDYNGRTIYVANKSQLLGTIKTNLPIRDISVSDNGVVAAVLEDSDVIRIFVYDGNNDTDEPIVQAKATMNKSGYPLAVTMSPNGYFMMVSYFHVDSGNMESKLAYYNFGEVGSNKVDNYVSGFEYKNSVIPYISFMNNKQSFGVANDRVVFFSGSEIPDNVGSCLIDEKILGVYSGDKYVGLVFLDTTGENLYKLVVFDGKANKIGTIPFDIDYTDIIFDDEGVVIYGGNECLIYSVEGEEKFSGFMNSTINLMIPKTSLKEYAVLTSSAIEIVELK